MASDDVLIQTAISSWEQVIKRVAILCLSCSEQQLFVEVAPGRNRMLYLWGHLIALNDAMFRVLRLGERLHLELDAVFIAQPDRSVPLPTSAEIAKCWEDVHTELLSRFKTLSSKEWLDRHGNVSPEEFEQNSTRTRLAVLLGRTNHASYHLGQMMLAKPKTP
jgi:DinB superfamily